MKALLLLLSLLLASNSSCAQANVKTPATAPTATHLSQPAVAPQPAVQLADTQMSSKDYYKNMYELAAASEAKAITQTWAALGIVIGVIAIIFAYQYFFNIRLDIAELDAVKAQFQVQLSDMQAAFLAKISDDILKNSNDLKQRDSELIKKNEELLASMNQVIFMRVHSAMSKELATMQESINQALASSQSELNRRDELYANIQFMKGNYPEALSAYVLILKEKMKNNEDQQDVLNDIVGALSKAKEIESKTVAEIEILLPSIQPSDLENARFIKECMDSFPIYEFVSSVKPYSVNRYGAGRPVYIKHKKYIKNTPE